MNRKARRAAAAKARRNPHKDLLERVAAVRNLSEQALSVLVEHESEEYCRGALDMLDVFTSCLSGDRNIPRLLRRADELGGTDGTDGRTKEPPKL